MKRLVLIFVLFAGLLIPADASARIWRRAGYYGYRPYVSAGVYVAPRSYYRPYYGGYYAPRSYYGGYGRYYGGYRGYYAPYYRPGFNVYPGGIGWYW